MGKKIYWRNADNGKFLLYYDELPVLNAHARASSVDGKSIDTRHADLKQEISEGNDLTLIFEKDGLLLTEKLSVNDYGAIAYCSLSKVDGSEVETNDLVPLVMGSKSDFESPYIWRDFESRVLSVPYDTDMWPRVEAVCQRPGRQSTDYSMIFNEETREGIFIGAMDFDVWKNSVAGSGFDCRTLEARCGKSASGDFTHDFLEHRTLMGKEISSSRFLVMYGADWRNLLESYGDLISSMRPIRKWSKGVPFGFNTFAALGCDLTEDNYRLCGKFIREELKDFQNNGTTYINLDGGWRDFPREDMLKVKDEHLAGGQQIGIYDSPFAYWGGDLDAEIPYLDEKHTYREIVVKDENGEPLPPLDTAYAYDVTHPIWQEWTRRKAKFYIDWGFRYLKVDFMSHAALEGYHYDKSVRTGRQALKIGYEFFDSLYTPEKVGDEFFLSFSISTLFPSGYANARRLSCDAFGLAEDVAFALNGLTYNWWIHGRLYQFNDPDHVVLHKSFCMAHESTEGEARARYTTAVIAGTVLLLSDDYENKTARERTKKIATNKAVNKVAASGVAFRPIDSAGSGACNIFTAKIDGVQYIAFFNCSGKAQTLSTTCERAGIERGTYRDLWTGETVSTSGGVISWSFSETDAALLKLENA